MPKRSLLVIALALTVNGFPITEAVAGDVNVGINIGLPAPPRIVLPAAKRAPNQTKFGKSN